jgi:hypothetical protein
MLGGVKMLRGMPVLRRITTANMATRQAKAQLHPMVSQLEALFAAFGLRFNLANLSKVGTAGGHGGLL